MIFKNWWNKYEQLGAESAFAMNSRKYSEQAAGERFS